MPVRAKLKSIKDERHLSDSNIATICDMSLSTVSRLFSPKGDEDVTKGQFESYISLAKGLNISLDWLAGLEPDEKQSVDPQIVHIINAYSKMLEEKDKRIEELKLDRKLLRILLITLVVVAWIVIDLLHGHFGLFQY